MSSRLSLHLDAMRALAALVVLLSHWAYPRFTGGDWLVIRELNLGSDAVVVFFVISGLVIAFAAERKDASGGAFLFSRATRLWSVALPALLLGFVLDRTGAALAPQAYDGWWYAPSLAAQLFHGLTFSSEWLAQSVRLGSNGPYWSLSYEVAYYLLFAAAFYLAGAARVAALAALAGLVGLKALLLMPIWLMGVLAWRIVAAGGPRLTPRAAWAGILLPPAIYAAALALGVPATLMALTEAATGLDRAGIAVALRFSDEFLWNWLVGALATLHILSLAALAASREAPAAPRFAPAIRWLAGASFSVYLVHYPLMQVLDACLPAAMPGFARDALLLAATFGLCLVFAQLFERPLPALRDSLSRLAGRLGPRSA